MTCKAAQMLLVLSVTAACKRAEVATSPEPQGSGAYAMDLDALGRSCKPEARAALVRIAADDKSHNTRCAAMNQLARLPPGPHWFHFPITDRTIAELDKPATHAALSRMLADRDRWCDLPSSYWTGTEPTAVSPAEVAAWTLSNFPVPSQRPEVEKLPTDLHAREAVLRSYDSFAKRHDIPAVTYIDSLTVDVSADGFERLLLFASAGYPWPASAQPASDDENTKAHGRVVATIEWLANLAAQTPGMDRYGMDCAQEMAEAVRTGSLGDTMLAKFDKFDVPTKIAILKVLNLTAHVGSRPQLERIAANDPDPEVRDWAADDLRAVDIGGEKNRQHKPLSGSAP